MIYYQRCATPVCLFAGGNKAGPDARQTACLTASGRQGRLWL
ncbi:MAG: hypothetical protein AB9834_22085 [Lentimicrobium sp.]